MKQILQHLRTGELEIADLPSPQVGPGSLLIRTRASLISAGTERMLVEFSKANMIQKARQQPDKVKMVLDKLKTDGVMPTMEAVFRKLDEPMPLGYCSMGEVLQVGRGVADIAPGDRVISNGPHAQIACVPRNLCAKVPSGVSDEEAAFTVMGAVALQGIRLAQPTLGDKFIVFGAGLLGLLAVQLLKAHGCEVMAVDLNAKRLAIAEEFGAKIVNPSKGGDPVAAAMTWTAGKGVDGVLITASARKDTIVHQAAQASRMRGRIILLGIVDLDLRRDDFYKKELSFQVSCSYGPGRYDEKYEQGGRDYPFGYVRWTEQRNFEAVLSAMKTGRLNAGKLITHHFAFDDALSAYEKIQNDPEALGVILQYPATVDQSPHRPVTQKPSPASGKPLVGVIGAGNFAKSILLPVIVKTPAQLAYVADIDAAAAGVTARKFGAGQAVTDYKVILNDPDVAAVFILVGHNLHSRFLQEVLESGKHAYVEKPLAMNAEELAEVRAAVEKASDRILMVGFNRRFSAHITKTKEMLAGRSEPLCMNMTVNGGEIPPDHWIQDPVRGGGRIIGEACHFIDLLSHLAGSAVSKVSAIMVGEGPAVRQDKVSIVLGFADGSIGTVNYFSNGSKNYPKETLEVFSDGRVLKLENFRKTTGWGFQGFKKFKTLRQDKGHYAQMAAFIERVSAGGPPLIPFDQLENVARASLAAVESAEMGKTIILD
jgi:predicted dehydrogenase/threonine dehydrogenase-like Zn-dependent dehydrogenase